MKNRAWELLRGAVDFHYHGWPEMALDVTCSCEDRENITKARDRGMRGIVLKSHFWPTVDKAFYLREQVEGIDIFSSVTLNSTAGGVHGYVAEAAARQEAKVLWFPTWTSRHDMTKPGFSGFVRKAIPTAAALPPAEGIDICPAGKLTEGAVEVLEVALRYDMAVSTGHMSPRESLALAREAAARGLTKLVFGHPMVPLIGADMDTMKEFVRCGGLVEFTYLPLLPYGQKLSLRQVAEAIGTLGPENCLLSSDHFSDWSPPECEMLRMFAAGLMENGVSEDAVRLMIADNPARLLY